jgi:hypothetical protein
MLRQHELPAIRLGTRWRVDARDLEAYLDAHNTTPEDERDGERWKV